MTDIFDNPNLNANQLAKAVATMLGHLPSTGVEYLRELHRVGLVAKGSGGFGAIPVTMREAVIIAIALARQPAAPKSRVGIIAELAAELDAKPDDSEAAA